MNSDEDDSSHFASAPTLHTPQAVQKILLDYDIKVELEREQERKDFLAVINNLCATFGQAGCGARPSAPSVQPGPPLEAGDL